MEALRWEQLKRRGPHVLWEAGASQGRGLRTETSGPPAEAVLRLRSPALWPWSQSKGPTMAFPLPQRF